MNAPSSDELRPASIEVTNGALEALRKTQGWVRFLGIASIVGACFAGLALLIVAITFAARGTAGVFRLAEGSVLLVVAVLYAVYWLGFANALKRLSNDEDVTEELLDEVLVRQRRLWLFQGILCIVVILIVVVGGIVVGMTYSRTHY